MGLLNCSFSVLYKESLEYFFAEVAFTRSPLSAFFSFEGLCCEEPSPLRLPRSRLPAVQDQRAPPRLRLQNRLLPGHHLPEGGPAQLGEFFFFTVFTLFRCTLNRPFKFFCNFSRMLCNTVFISGFSWSPSTSRTSIRRWWWSLATPPWRSDSAFVKSIWPSPRRTRFRRLTCSL